MDNCMDLQALICKNKQKKTLNFKPYQQSKKEQRDLIKIKFQIFVRKRKG